MNNVLVLRQADDKVAAQAKRHGLKTVVLAAGYEVEFDRALIVEPGVCIPWPLVDYGLHFVERWDAAAPLWRYGVLAQDVGTPSDRRRTQAVTRDLRVLLYGQELLFVRNSPGGLALLEALQWELTQGEEPRLAFLRALYTSKPIFCTLPASWLAQEAAAVTSARAAAIAQARAAQETQRARKRAGRSQQGAASRRGATLGQVEKKERKKQRHLHGLRAGLTGYQSCCPAWHG